jgi:hypothetical protein
VWQLNAAFMVVWVGLFTTMLYTGFLSKEQHPGRDPDFWRRACQEGRRGGCTNFVRILDSKCRDDSGPACFALGHMLSDGRAVPRDEVRAAVSFANACEVGFQPACGTLRELSRSQDLGAFQRRCEQGDGPSCYVLGSLSQAANGAAPDMAIALFSRACAGGSPHGCNQLVEMSASGNGTVIDTAALENLERACHEGLARSCYRLGVLYRSGTAGARGELLARARLQRACELGLTRACPGPGQF